ncbi:MAG TPA: PLP-dependent aminotransferase family protein [Candidatus Nitrosotalea sp.]|jgi:DNA-binding transcriptional MocR family regulator|nr:PLP-dependent aminotransferase family protein [Candidatus Nitrosotalea sp.]
MEQSSATIWLPRLEGRHGPLYLMIADALEADIESGRVKPGERLPAQRALAATLNIDFTTVGRAFAEARRRGLIEASVGRGSFARRPVPSDELDSLAAVDMTMNLPPLPASLDLKGRIERGFATVLARPDFAGLLTYRDAAGGGADRQAGLDWLAPRLADSAATADRLLIAGGVQTAIAASLTTIAKAGDLILAESLTYPGLTLAAQQFGLRLHGLDMDAQGLLPAALEEACQRLKPRALYCVPVLHSPTTATMTAERRQAIAEIARRHRLTIIEDDTYGLLARQAPQPIAHYAPELTIYLSGLAKVMTPALRVAYLLAPDAQLAQRLATALRALTGMAPPLMVSLASSWIRSGEAQEILTALRQESMARQRLAADLLPPELVQTAPEAHHLWLHLPPSWSRAGFVARLQSQHLTLVPSDAFCVSREGAQLPAPEAVRLCLGAAPDQRLLHRALILLAVTLREPQITAPVAVV